MKYVLTITYNFDGDYVALAFDSYNAAVDKLNEMLEEEVEIVKRESEYNPSVLKWADDDITLVYAEGYKRNERFNYLREDQASYRVFEIQN